MDHNQDSFGILRINLLISLELFISSKIYPDLRTSSLSVCLVAINGRRLKWEEWKVNEIWNVGHSCVRSKGMGVVSSSEEAPATSCLALESSIRWQDPNIWCQGGGVLFLTRMLVEFTPCSTVRGGQKLPFQSRNTRSLSKDDLGSRNLASLCKFTTTY